MTSSLATLLYVAAAGMNSAGNHVIPLQCNGAEHLEQRIASATNGALLQTNGTDRVWVEINEDGRALHIEGAQILATLATPPRLARYGFWAPSGAFAVEVRDKADPGAPVSFNIRMYCRSAKVRAASIKALSEASDSMSQGNSPPGTAWGAAGIESTEPDVRAYAAHLFAQRQLLADRSSNAAEAFKQVEHLWSAANDPARALAARTAWAEEEYKLGHYQAAVVAGAKLPAQAAGAIGYYTTRLANNRCVALRSLGRFDEAMRCYEALARRFAGLSEPLDRTGVLLNLAALQRDRGLLTAMEASIFEATRQISAEDIRHMPQVDVAVMTGRVHLMRAELALSRGDVGIAMAGYDAALSNFRIGKANRWHANTLMQMAYVFGRIGEYGDAYALWTKAFISYSPGEAPARIANALMLLARIERSDGNPEIASWLARQARQRFAKLNSVAEPQAAQIDELRALLDAGAVADAEGVARSLGDVVPRHRNAWLLARSALALAQQDPGLAMSLLDALPANISLDDGIDRDVLHATVMAAKGDRAGALDGLARSLALIESGADSSSNVLLRDLLQRRGDPLRAAKLSLLLDRADSQSDIDALLRLIPTVQPGASDISRKVIKSTPSFEDLDAIFSRELLFAADGTAASSGLAAVLAKQASHAPTPSPSTTSLRGIQAGLREGDAVLAILDAGEHATALWITAHSLTMRPTAAPSVLRDGSRLLAEALRDRNSSPAAIEKHARAMADAIWADNALPRRADHLYIVASPLAGSIAWAVLPDAEGAPLLASTDISLVHLAPGGRRGRLELPSVLSVAVASQESPGRTTATALAPLAGARAESELLASAAQGIPLDVLNASASSVKTKLLDAIARPGAWVHVAAHGTTRPGYLGRSGLWLEPEAPNGLPEFLSVLDLYEKGARADLVVLNACELAARDSRSPNALGFADTLVRLGVRNVVAASWTISDHAAVTWTTAFYQTLTAQGAEPAHALRLAQQQLANSRPYRHPYYWASFVHLGVLASGESGDATSPVGM